MRTQIVDPKQRYGIHRADWQEIRINTVRFLDSPVPNFRWIGREMLNIQAKCQSGPPCSMPLLHRWSGKSKTLGDLLLGHGTLSSRPVKTSGKMCSNSLTPITKSPGAGWPSHTPRHRVSILVASYDLNVLQRVWFFPVTTRGAPPCWLRKIKISVFETGGSYGTRKKTLFMGLRMTQWQQTSITLRPQV